MTLIPYLPLVGIAIDDAPASSSAETKPVPKDGNREHLANFRKGRRRIDYYAAASVVPYLEFFQAQHPGASVSALINGAIEFAYEQISGNLSGKN